ncbi:MULTISPECIES: hypothetical protein [Nocardioides]|uniref:Uncharacterized protein n=1 Tax=Nocardioides vastitatis TaxID=2568655 RepID=A0ABW0ZMI7_9ACTN|nr:hypothetical protein [Nocardioides sp.]THJ08161.1 hypothetical protein E7Z54_04985 [Nocardioides sp.]
MAQDWSLRGAVRPAITGGLVNITVVVDGNEILEDVNVAVPVALHLAAQVCGNSIGVIAQDLRADGTCTNTSTGDTFQIDQR